MKEEKSEGELFLDTKLSSEKLEETKNIGEENIDRYIKESFKSEEEKEQQENSNKVLRECYYNIIDLLKLYCDWKESYYPIVACWIIGTYFHDKMITYPYLYFNASKESGKSRSVRLITYLSKDGEMMNSMTEAVLFRTKGTLGIDEFEKASRKGNENLMELLNSGYKRGTKIKRMKKQKTEKGEEQVVEEFDVFRPIVLANIWGMDTVLEDRTLPLYLEKTTRSNVSNLLEIWEYDKKTTLIKGFLEAECSLCNVVSLQNIYVDWNDYLIINNITTGTNNYIKLHLFERIKKTGLKGRMLELSFPLILIAEMIDEKVLDDVINSLQQISIEKAHEAFLENKDVLLVDMISQEPENSGWVSIKRLAEKFREFTQTEDEWINSKWVGRAIKRLLLTKERKRTEKGIEVLLDINKAKEKMRMFK